MTPMGDMFYAPGNRLYSNDFSSADLVSRAMFVHEAFHVYQYQRGISVLSKGAAAQIGNFAVESYDYSEEFAKEEPFYKWNIEAQAQFVQDYYFQLEYTKLNGVPLNSLLTVEQYESVNFWSVRKDDPKCFPAHTRIQTSLITSVAISTLSPGDIVLSYDARANKGRGGLVPRRVVRIYRNTTTEWIRLSWVEGGERRELVATPGHHFLDQFGQFPTIAEMTRTGRATVVLASGALAEVTAERIVHSAETAHLFERAVAHAATAGNAALQPVELEAWATCNFEVEGLRPNARDDRTALRSRFDSSNDDRRTSTDARRRGRAAGLTRRRGSRNNAVSRQGRGKTWLPASSHIACCISAIATSRARPITRPT